MTKIELSNSFKKWHAGLKGSRAYIATARAIENIQSGNFGNNCNTIKKTRQTTKLFEYKIKADKAFRIYYTRKDNVIFVLAGGDKDSQNRDIESALSIISKL